MKRVNFFSQPSSSSIDDSMYCVEEDFEEVEASRFYDTVVTL